MMERQRPICLNNAVQVAICGVGVILPQVKSRLLSKSSSVNISIDLTVTEPRYLTHAGRLDTK